MTKVAAIQQNAAPANVPANLEMCERLADDAAADGAEIIVLPEFFTTGMGFLPQLSYCAQPVDGQAAQLLKTLARRHHVTIGGSFLCRENENADAYNTFLLVDPDGKVVGRHDKDLPTMWENCFYVGGDDDGVLPATGGFTPGAAVCWEFMRTQSVHRMRGKVDIVLGGSAWWSVPPWPPRGLMRRWEEQNAATAAKIAPAFARMVGAPVVHAAHCGAVDCRMPLLPVRYHGHMQGGAVIAAADGTVLARRDRAEGAGFAIADVTIGRVDPLDSPRSGFWLHDRGPVPAACWAYQNWHGRRWYAKHARKVRAAVRSGRSA